MVKKKHPNLVKYFNLRKDYSWKYKNFFQWIIDNHWVCDKYKIIYKKDKELYKFMFENANNTQCFANSMGFAGGMSKHLNYVQGFVFNGSGLPLSHAWNVSKKSGKIIDFTYNTKYTNPFKHYTYVGVIELTKKDIDILSKTYKNFMTSHLLTLQYALTTGTEPVFKPIWKITKEREIIRVLTKEYDEKTEVANE